MIALYLLFVENKYYFEIQNVGETRLSGGPDNAKIARKIYIQSESNNNSFDLKISL